MFGDNSISVWMARKRQLRDTKLTIESLLEIHESNLAIVMVENKIAKEEERVVRCH